MPGGRHAPNARARSRPSWAASMPPCQPSPFTPDSGVYIRVLPAGGKGDVSPPPVSLTVSSMSASTFLDVARQVGLGPLLVHHGAERTARPFILGTERHGRSPHLDLRCPASRGSIARVLNLCRRARSDPWGEGNIGKRRCPWSGRW